MTVQAPLAAEPLTLTTGDGAVLSAYRYPSENPQATVVIASAMGVPQSYYRHFAAFLVEHGYQALTFDYRGMGESGPGNAKASDARLLDWGRQDLPTALAWAREQGLPALMAGHSVGGQIFGLAAEDTLAGCFLVASQHGDWRNWDGYHRWRIWFLWRYAMPLATKAFGYWPSSRVGMGEDLPPGVAMEWCGGGQCEHYLHGLMTPEEVALYDRYTGPVRLVTFDDDSFAPQRAGARLLEDYYPKAQTEHLHLAPAEVDRQSVDHFGYFRPWGRERLWPLATEFFAACLRKESPRGGPAGHPAS